jgi:anti-anti-sigma factor
MDIRVEPEGSVVRLVLQGRLDATWADPLVEAVALQVRAGQHTIVLDLGAVDFLSSAGIRALVRSQRMLVAVRGSFRLASPTNLIRTTLKTAGLLALVHDETRAEPERVAQSVSKRSATADWSGVWDASPPSSQIEVLGHPDALEAQSQVACAAQELCVGIGALGEELAAAAPRAGEFLAAAGLAATLPTDGARVPDYVLAAAGGNATSAVLHGLRSTVPSLQPLRFEAHSDAVTPLAEWLSTLLDIAGTACASFAALVEAHECIGACRLAPPARSEGFTWPQVRNELAFTTERSAERRTALLVGFVARPDATLPPALQEQLRPHGATLAHVHALLFPYRPLPRQHSSLRAALEEQLNAAQPQSLLHLVADDRGPEGVGETELLRGTVWLARSEVRT